MTSTRRTEFYQKIGPIKDVEYLDEYLSKLGKRWVFRAQLPKHKLTTSLERDCKKSGYKLRDYAPQIETEMIRQFARVYDGIDRSKVQEDKLYCLSLMRHFGAPTRLLDFTYSRYVAIYFALECVYENKIAAIWCIDEPALTRKASVKNKSVSDLIIERTRDELRDDTTFDDLYIDSKHTFVTAENPLQIHRRLNLQQSVFLCPGNIRKKFETNLVDPYGQHELPTPDIRKVIFKPDDLEGAFEKYYRMNLTRESLFPGLDGFAQSMRYQLWLYKLIHYSREDLRKGG